MSFSFRLRFNVSNNRKLPFEEAAISILNLGKIKINLHSSDRTLSIKDSNKLILKGNGYDTENEALVAGENYRDRLVLAFAKLRFAADFGDRAPKSFVTLYGLEMMKGPKGSPVLNDIHGLQVYHTDLKPSFASIDNCNVYITLSRETTLKAFEVSFSSCHPIDEKKRLAFELLSASSFTNYVDARFILSMMALETLIEQEGRDAAEQQLINELLEQVKQSAIPKKESLLGALNNLKTESIGTAGRRLARNLQSSYMDMEPEKFFKYCYNLRSQLVHGDFPRPTSVDVGGVCTALQEFVADLICYPDLST